MRKKLIISGIVLIIFVVLVVVILFSGTCIDCNGWPRTCIEAGGICTPEDCDSLKDNQYVKNLVLGGENGGCQENENCCVHVLTEE